ncbi:MAG: hypothetical protein ACI88A_002170 [Paraglaciecola sp.]|jgi:hypothetical protein
MGFLSDTEFCFPQTRSVVNIPYPFLLCLLLIASYAGGAIDQQAQEKADLERALFPENYQSLTVEERQILLIIKENTTPIARGVAVMIGESGRSMVSHDSLSPLSQQLNNLGWVTMLMPAPQIGLTIPPTEKKQATDPGKSNTTAILAKSVAPPIDGEQFLIHEQQLILQMRAILNKSKDYPGFFLVIAQGTSAAWLAKIYAEESLDSPDAFVAISPFWPSREYNIKLADYLANTSMPVLDIYNDWDNKWSLQSYPARQIAATKALKLHYRQREIIGLAIENQQPDYIGKEIYGWLSFMGW